MKKLLTLSVILGILGCMVALAMGQDKHADMKGIRQASSLQTNSSGWMRLR